MNKFTRTIAINLQSLLAYRFNFLTQQIRAFILLLTLFLFWASLYQGNTSLFGYSKDGIFAYLIGIAFLRSLVFVSSADIAGMIRNGSLSKYLLWPVNLFAFLFAGDVADKIIATIFSILEVALIVMLFHFPFYLPHHFSTYIFFIVITLLAIVLGFFINLIISLTAFWTEDPWSTSWVFDVIFMSFLSGSYFPINILPGVLPRLIELTPFPYLLYFPVKIWLEQTTVSQTISIIVICAIWTIFLYSVAKIWFRRGTRNFSAYGG